MIYIINISAQIIWPKNTWNLQLQQLKYDKSTSKS